MRRADLIVASAVVVSAMLVAAVAIGATTPEALRLPVHWNAMGIADRSAGKWTALLVPPAITAAFTACLALLPAIEPTGGLRRSEGLYRAIWAGMLVVLAAADLAVVAAARGGGVTRSGLHFFALGVLLLLVGNQSAKSRPMRFVGIRTPWTRANVDTWIATHRLAGRLMIAAALVCWGFVAVGSPPEAARFVIAAVLASVLIPAAYSFFDWSGRTQHD